jgi:hypothetical protein
MDYKQAWFITINTNSTNTKFETPLREVWNYILENISSFSHGLKGSKIIRVRENSKLEIGPKDHKVHIHGLVEISSVGMVSLNYSGIKKFIDEQLRKQEGFVGCHFDAQYVKGYDTNRSIMNISNYIEKDQD